MLNYEICYAAKQVVWLFGKSSLSLFRVEQVCCLGNQHFSPCQCHSPKGWRQRSRSGPGSRESSAEREHSRDRGDDSRCSGNEEAQDDGRRLVVLSVGEASDGEPDAAQICVISMLLRNLMMITPFQ